MSIVLSMLRGINVSGGKMIKMADLKALYEELGFLNVQTYIQSGNVIFESRETDDPAKQIEWKIQEQFGFKVSVLVRTAVELQRVLMHNPFVSEKNIIADKLHVTFLEEAPSSVNREKLYRLNDESDRFIVDGREIFLYCPNGYGKTKLTNTFFESKLKLQATTRNWRTVNEIVKRMV